ncbi:type IV secretory system conjugative DNA transfer family protein [Streptomyces sp. NPDC058469]|uniref:type IV secretory system conjugative DNA transfer family protein n=1 Tax=Streptomyces sp. NPDC058469 TaxID=3346514 RepID=UPI0036687558
MATQRPVDDSRRTYLVTFPREVAHDSVLNFIRALSGLPKPRLLRRIHTVVFETYADAAGIKHYMSIPGHVVADVEGQLRTHVPGASLLAIESTEDFIGLTTWDHVLEIGMSHGAVPLHIVKPEAVVATMLTPFSPLKPRQSVMMQWVISPAKRQAPPAKKDEDRRPPWPNKHVDPARRRDKLKEPTFIAMARIAAGGPDAEDVTQRVYGALASTHSYGVSFTKLLGSQKAKQERLKARATSLVLPCHLNAYELSAVIGIPFGMPNVPGLPQGRARHLAPDASIPSTGVLVGTSTYPGLHRPLAIDPMGTGHRHVLGKTGTGKSTFMGNTFIQEMDQGFGGALIDIHGDLAEDVMARIPRHRIGDVIVFDPTDTDHPIGFNVFHGNTSPEVVADQMMAIFHGIYKDSGIYANNYLRAVIQTLAAVPGMTLVEVPHFLSDEGFRRSIVSQTTDPVLKSTWNTYDSSKQATQAQMAAPAIHRVQPLLMRSAVRLSLGQSNNSLNMREIILGKKILIVSIPKGLLGPETSILFGSLVVAQLYQAAQGIAPADRYPFHFYVDEAQNFLNMPQSLPDMLSEARKYKLNLTLAHQLEAQMPLLFREGLHSNTRSKFIFQVSSSDAAGAVKEIGPPLTPVDFTSLGQFEMVMQTTTHENKTSAPATVRTNDWLPKTISPAALRVASRTQWARTASEVESEIRTRQTASQQVKHKPAVGWKSEGATND